MDVQENFGGDTTEAKMLLEEQQDSFLKQKADNPVGVLAVHVFGCHNMLLDGESFPDEFKAYAKISVASLTKTTEAVPQARRGKFVWNQILHFPIVINTHMKDWSNQVIFTVHGHHSTSTNKHKLVGKVTFHIHKQVKVGWSMDKYELKNRKKLKTGYVELEFAFCYGLFGYGFSDQLENLIHTPEDVLRQSMFPRVRSPDENQFTKWSLLTPHSVPHPVYVPFKEFATDLKPDIFCTGPQDNFLLKIPKPRPLLKDAMPRLARLRNDYLAQSGRREKVMFLRRLIHAKETYQGDEESDTSDDEQGGYIPAALASLLSNAARATITQTIPGVTIRTRANYDNLKVDVSVETMVGAEDVSSENNVTVPMNSSAENNSSETANPFVSQASSSLPCEAQIADVVINSKTDKTFDSDSKML